MSLVSICSFLYELISTLVVFAAVGIAIAVFVARREYQFITKVSTATNPEGVERLAKYLAIQTGGKKINVENIWPSFIPVAMKLHDDHLKKRRELIERAK